MFFSEKVDSGDDGYLWQVSQIDATNSLVFLCAATSVFVLNKYLKNSLHNYRNVKSNLCIVIFFSVGLITNVVIITFLWLIQDQIYGEDESNK